ncbi:sarcosine oxidase subunit delta [Sulfitobacter guttiformis]|uniref:sarcosine oxidase subunit delta n=1 Tax=Sulfitobacter guttiformis TaxID=74349 RepID=UPI000469CE7F|nr:sarcosine oxidase subunit delta [Sulfitobacter guttiformis]KIN73176.1 Sarcosine oxidase, delta subunit [Sulfitobacter guttiformis KCTC 32187]
MRIVCPLCGARDRREFYYRGAALLRPSVDAEPDAWDAYVHLRENPAGRTRDLWQHDAGCRAWLVVTRDTVTHEIYGVELAAKFAKDAGT